MGLQVSVTFKPTLSSGNCSDFSVIKHILWLYLGNYYTFCHWGRVGYFHFCLVKLSTTHCFLIVARECIHKTQLRDHGDNK